MFALAIVLLQLPLPPLPGGVPRGDMPGGCTLPGVVAGKPVPAALRRGRGDGTPAVRILRPGDQATMDLQPARRNVHVDANGIVTHVTCG